MLSHLQGIPHLGDLEFLRQFQRHARRGREPGAVACSQFFYIRSPEDRNGLFELFLAAKSQVCPADHGIYITPAGLAGHMFQGVDKSGMTAPQQDHETPVGFQYQRLIIRCGIHILAGTVMEQPPVARFELRQPWHLAGQKDSGRQFPEFGLEVKARTRSFQGCTVMGQADGKTFAGILDPVAR